MEKDKENTKEIEVKVDEGMESNCTDVIETFDELELK